MIDKDKLICIFFTNFVAKLVSVLNIIWYFDIPERCFLQDFPEKIQFPDQVLLIFLQ